MEKPTTRFSVDVSIGPKGPSVKLKKDGSDEPIDLSAREMGDISVRLWRDGEMRIPKSVMIRLTDTKDKSDDEE